MSRRRGGRGVRVTGGEHKGRQLPVPGGARPTEGRVREALFSIWGPRLARARLLDLFAGSGVVAVEAVGRGALAAWAVERNPRAQRGLEATVEQLGLRGIVEIVRGDLPDALTGETFRDVVPFDLVFADPPYDFPRYEDLLNAVPAVLAPEGDFALEHSGRLETPVEIGELVRADIRRYGDSALSFYRRPATFERPGV